MTTTRTAVVREIKHTAEPESKRSGSVIEVPLGGRRGAGLVTLIDPEDYPLVSAHSWHVQNYGYACTSVRQDGRETTVVLHRLILGLTDRKIVTDHINRIKLDNRRLNLRVCIQAQNCQNLGLHRRNTSGFRGVYWNKLAHRWCAQVFLHRQNHTIGLFDTAEQAAAAASAWRAEHMTHSEELPSATVNDLLL